MNPLQTLNPMFVPVAVPVAVPVPAPMVARRVPPPQAKPPTPLETVAKVVDGVNQLVGVAKKLFGGTGTAATAAATRAVRPATARRVPHAGHPAHTAQPEFLPDDQPEFLPDDAFDPPAASGAGGDWGDTGTGAGGDWSFDTPTEAPAAPGWDMSQMLGFDPSQMLGNFDPNMLAGCIDPTSGW